MNILLISIVVIGGINYIREKYEEKKLIYFIIMLLSIFIYIRNIGFSLIGYMIVIVHLSALVVLFGMVLMAESKNNKMELNNKKTIFLILTLFILYIIYNGDTLSMESNISEINERIGIILTSEIEILWLILLGILLLVALIGVLYM